MSTADKLTSIINSKTAIKNAIEGKGVTVGEAPLANYASLIGQIETGGGSSSSSPSSGPATDLFIAFNNNFNVSGGQKYIIAKGEQYSQMDMGAASSWGGNFTSDPDFGYVFTLPNQDETEEWERMAYAVKVPFNLWAWMNDNTSWTVEFWHKPGSNFNTYSNGAIFEALDSYGGGFNISFGQDNTTYNFKIIGMERWPQQYSGIANSWNHIALVCNEGTLYFYINGERKIDNIQINLNDPYSYYIPNKGFWIGYSSNSDYRDYSMAKVRLSNIARYTGATFTPSKAYTAD